MSSFFEPPKDLIFDNTQPHTVVVLGPPRSGTSMVAGILRLLGIYMGQCNVKNHEDSRFNQKESIESIRALIHENNENFPIWGWKEPSTHKYWEEVEDVVRKPYFIGVYRNILSSAASKLKHTGTADLLSMPRSIATHYQKISTLMMKPEIPCLFVNYDEVISDPVELAGFLSLRLQGKALEDDMAERIALFCAPGQYKSIQDFQ